MSRFLWFTVYIKKQVYIQRMFIGVLNVRGIIVTRSQKMFRN